MIEGQSKKVSQEVHDVVVSQIGDNDAQSSDKYSGNMKLDPLLRLFPGAPFMCISNEDLKKGDRKWDNMQVCQGENEKKSQNDVAKLGG